MFVSMNYYGTIAANNISRTPICYQYSLIDTNFTIISTISKTASMELPTLFIAAMGYVVWNEYSTRNLDVARDLVRSFLYFEKQYYTNKYSKSNLDNQDKYCSKYIPNWKIYADKRNELYRSMMLIR